MLLSKKSIHFQKTISIMKQWLPAIKKKKKKTEILKNHEDKNGENQLVP